VKSRLILLLALLGVLACQERRQSAATLAESPAVGQARRIGLDGYGAPVTTALASAAATVENALPPVSPADVSAMVIRTADVTIEVDSLETAIAGVRDVATRFGGYLASTEIKTGKNELRNGRLEMKIPATRFDESLAGLAPIGKLESVSVEAQDVGEEFVDVNARMENARRLERRLIELLATRTGKLKDVLDVEQALARVREEIERYEGRIRYLRAHTAMSTLSISVHEPVPIVASAGRGPIGEAFRQAWRNFVSLIAVSVQSLGVIIPLGAVALLVWIGARRWRRVFTQRTA
jgi:hypothetical protein